MELKMPETAQKGGDFMKKRWISFLLAVVMVLGMVPSGVMAEPAPEERVYTQDLTVC